MNRLIKNITGRLSNAKNCEMKCIYLCIYLCNRHEFSIQTALQHKVLGGPDEHSLPSALRYGPDGTKQLRHLWRKHSNHVNHLFTWNPAIARKTSPNLLLHNGVSLEQIRHEQSIILITINIHESHWEHRPISSSVIFMIWCSIQNA